MPAKHVGELCKRCNILEATLTVRSEPICRDCFSKYIHTKVVKRMEDFRTRHNAAGEERKLLLLMSLGVSSVSLLHILDQHLKTQKQKTGRTGFSLHVLHITSPAETEDLDAKLASLEKSYPNHTFSSEDLDDIFAEKGALNIILNQLPSASSVADVLSILRTRYVVQFARQHSCEAILWGDSTTKLAEKVLAETAKGRGYALPWHVADGPSPYGIPFYFPLRDVLKKELITHSRLTDPSLESLLDGKVFEKTQAPPSAKNTTIDVLMKQYFEDVEENYPSIVSNVVKTSGKLGIPVSTEGFTKCKLCELHVGSGRMGVEGWGGHQEVEKETNLGPELCYGCSRSLPAELVHLIP